MRQQIHAENRVSDDGTPAGGHVVDTGISIVWQNGALAVDGVRREPNGAFVEGVIEAAKQRLEHYQTTRFACAENSQAIEQLQAALESLDSRTKGREARGVEGSHQV